MTDVDRPALALDTRLQQKLAEDPPGGEPVAPPIYQTATYALPTPELGAALAAQTHPQKFYTRYGSPNVAEVEAQIAALEGAEAALAVGSGMAAIVGTILAHVRAGDHVVAQETHYTAALTFFEDWLPRQGVAVTRVEQTDPNAFAAALRPETKLVYIETPTNPTMALTDIAAVSALAKGAGAALVIDNTFASSFNQRPIALGADLVIHSATKYLNGHSDVTAGVVAGPRALVAPIEEYARVHGPLLHPMEAWLLLRGMRTYALRMRRHNASGLAVATALERLTGVAKVHYPGLESHPQRALAAKQMPGGFGGMLAFELDGDGPADQFARAKRLLERVRLCVSAVSLGAVETLITHPASLIFSKQDDAALEAAGVSAGLIRLSVGLEDPDDILADVAQALG